MRVGLQSLALAALLCLPAGLLATAALATPAWLSPVDLSAAGQGAEAPEAGVDTAGNAVAVWSRYDGTNTTIQSATRPAGGTWQPPVDLSAVGRDATEPEVTVAPAGNAVAVWSRSNGSNTIIQSAGRPAGGSWEPPVDLSAAGRNATEPQVAVDLAGNAVAVWSRYDGTNTTIQSATRPAGGTWQPPVDLSAVGRDATEPEVTVAPAGNAVAVWSRSNGSNTIIQSATRPAGGAWLSPVDLSAAGQDAEAPQVTVAPAGNAVAIWSRSNGTNTIIQSAGRPAGGSWEPPVDLSAAGRNATEPQVTVAPAGNAVAIWSRSYGTPYTIIQSAGRPAGGSWEPPVDLSAAGVSAAVAPQVAVNSVGDATAVWSRSYGAPATVQSATRPVGGTWGPPLDLSVIGRNAVEPEVVLDAAGDGLALWSRDNGSNTVVQAAGHDATGPQLRALAIPAAGTMRQPVVFSVSPLDIWSPVASISWSFGDSSGANGATATHTFDRPGVYQVSVVAADAPGHTSSATGTITIFPKAWAARNALVRHGRAQLRLHCTSPVGCEGELKLIAGVRTKRHRRLVAKRLRIGKAVFVIPGAQTTTVPVKLSVRGRAAVGQAGKRGLKAQLTGPGVKHRTVVLEGELRPGK